MAKRVKTCAYHLCGKTLDPDRAFVYAVRYCRLQCYRNAKQWRWRHRKPKARARQQVRHAKRVLRANIKKTYAARRHPLLARSLKVTAKTTSEDSRESSAE